jgi:hypothetical protein
MMWQDAVMVRRGGETMTETNERRRKRPSSGERVAARREHWRGLVAAWGKSGLTQVEFCRREAVQPPQFSWWKHHLARVDRRVPGKAKRRPMAGQPSRATDVGPSPFISLGLVTGRRPGGPRDTMVLALSGHARIVLGPAFDGEALRRLLAVLRDAGLATGEARPC